MHKALIIVTTLLFFSKQIKAQVNNSAVTEENTILLTELISDLESRNNIKVSYNPEILKGLEVPKSLHKVAFEEAIEQIEAIYWLTFEKIDTHNYFIKEQLTDRKICGYLSKKKDGEAIEGANIVSLKSLEGTTSDKDGYFQLENMKKDDRIAISFLGYETYIMPLNSLLEKQCITYTLKAKEVQLDEVVVQDYLGAGMYGGDNGIIKIYPASLEILSGLSEPDILQNIQLLPGIESPQETASGLFVRGGTPDQNLILWDGIKMYNSSHFFGMISAFNPYVVDKVKVSRSASSAQYGDRVSGVVDMVSDSAIPDKFSGQFGLNTLHADVNLKVPLSKKAGVILSGRRSFVDAFNSPMFKNFSNKVFQNTGLADNNGNFEQEVFEQSGNFHFSDFSIKSIFELSDKDKIFVSGIANNNTLDYNYSYDNFGSTLNFSEKLSIKNFGLSATWEKTWNNSFSSKILGYYSQYKFRYSDEDPFLRSFVITEKQNDINEIGFFFHTNYTMGKQLRFSNGYQFFSNRVSYSLGNSNIGGGLLPDISGNTRAHTHTLFNQLEYRKQGLSINLGLRTSYYHLLTSIFLEPRINLDYQINSRFALRGGFELKNQSIAQIQEFTTQELGLENKIWALAETDGTPLLKSKQFNLGMLYTYKGWKLDIDFYAKQIDGITSVTNGFDSSINNFIDGSSTILGLDVLIKKKIGSYTTWLGYTLSSNYFRFDEIIDGKKFRGNNDIRNSLTWSHFYKWKNLQFSLGWKYRSGTPFTPAIGFNETSPQEITIAYGDFNSKTLPDYHRLDISMQYDFKLSKKQNAPRAKLGMSLLNAYDRKSILNTDFMVTEQTSPTTGLNQPILKTINRYSLTITPNFMFRLEF
ncbi:MAG: TonB-dependent receptor [Flavobacteriaceae bacterium]|nr:TonB-dependent receptor [Flavobacteriaceae bacterium]